MTDPAYKILASYYAALNTKVTVDSVVIPVYTVTPKGTSGNRIEMSIITQVNDSIKDAYLQNVVMSVDCITEFTTRGSLKKSVDISNAVIQLIITTFGGSGLSITGGGFKYIRTALDNITPAEEITDTMKIYRQILTFTNLIQQI